MPRQTISDTTALHHLKQRGISNASKIAHQIGENGMKVLHVTETAQGGVGTYLGELLPLQIEKLGPENVRVITPQQHAFQIGRLPDQVLSTYSRAGRSIGCLRTLSLHFKSVLEEFQPDVVHVHSTFAGLIVRAQLGWKTRRSSIVYCPHGWSFARDTSGWKRRGAELLERLLANWSDRIVMISQHEWENARAIGIPADKLELVLNGIGDANSTKTTSKADDRLHVLFVGRLDRQKGYDTLLDAVLPLGTTVSVRIAGVAVADGRSVSSGDPIVEQLGWLSPEAIRDELAESDVLVIPSRWEGFGLVALEAMRAGRMVIASDVGGLPEIVDDGETGWLVPPDDPAALALLLLKAKGAPRSEMGQSGRRRYLANFTSERMHLQILDIYRSCNKGGGARRTQPILN